MAAVVSTTAATDVGREMHELVADLYPLCRSITGDGVRETLRRVAKQVPLEVREVPSGTQVFDWVVPPEWNIRAAHITGPDGRRVVDFETSNLHVMSYSVPIRARLSRSELDSHLHSLPERPDWVPYRTSYYSEDWGFCLSERQRATLGDGEYEVVIDSELRDGHLTYGELLIPGETDDEVLVSCHVCHPSLANDNLSGIAVATYLADRLRSSRNRYSYRFLFIPGTIGAITWLSANQSNVDRIKHGLVLACVGDGAPFTYKRSRRGDATIDRAVAHALAHRPGLHEVVDFSPWGYDERQFCSPGFDLPVGGLTRSPQGRFPEYHTSADDLSLVDPTHLAESLSLLIEVVGVLEGDRSYLNVNPMCEPRLGARGLYPSVGGRDAGVDQVALLWVLNLSDGTRSLLDIAERADLPFAAVRAAADALRRVELLEPRP
jgi:aminopeptidase-like protein